MTNDSQRLSILRWLAQGRTLTTLQAWQKFDCTTASQRCRELRKKHRVPVQSEIVLVGKKRVARYWIPEAKLALARRMLAAS